MTQPQISRLMEQYVTRHPGDTPVLVETHISWVIMAKKEVFKIKKPLKFSFLDFSTLQQRRYFCEREVALNRRLAPDMYLGVIPICEKDGLGPLGEGCGPVVEYAVRMRRMDETRQLDRLLEKGGVTPAEMDGLAQMLADFHRDARVVAEAEDWLGLYREFDDLRSVFPVLESTLGADAGKKIVGALNQSRTFLKGLVLRIEARKGAGFVRDGHGDLHCRNIFMTHPPVIFDCIEFSDELRTLDVLSEIGFLCMDLERFGRGDLSDAFARDYQGYFPCIENEDDQRLLLFYKMYRANVRMKVTALALGPSVAAGKPEPEAVGLLKSYSSLFDQYAARLFSC